MNRLQGSVFRRVQPGGQHARLPLGYEANRFAVFPRARPRLKPATSPPDRASRQSHCVTFHATSVRRAASFHFPNPVPTPARAFSACSTPTSLFHLYRRRIYKPRGAVPTCHLPSQQWHATCDDHPYSSPAHPRRVTRHTPTVVTTGTLNSTSPTSGYQPAGLVPSALRSVSIAAGLDVPCSSIVSAVRHSKRSHIVNLRPVQDSSGVPSDLWPSRIIFRTTHCATQGAGHRRGDGYDGCVPIGMPVRHSASSRRAAPVPSMQSIRDPKMTLV